ncbi:MAG: AAA family ATPase, partial [Lachnospiraceae bacterium]|nr:AAA family ATPase [Lachnospiraceae bacterium]
MSQTGDWSGNMFDFFYRVSAKLTLDLKKPFKLVNMVRQDETPIHDAVREALVNTLTNADFYEPRGVVIEKYPDRIILENPGTVIVGKKQMLRGGISEPRNEAVMKMFNLIG